jgi:malate permease and related proteins
MSDYLYILRSISLPIVLLIVLGYIFQKKIKTNTKSYSKVLLFLFTPVVIFVKMYQIDIIWDSFIQSILFIIIFQVCMALFGIILSKIFKYTKSKKNALCNSFVLFNSGNYGIPLIELTFKNNPVSMASQLIIMVIQSILSNTYGVYQASAGSGTQKQALKNVLEMPALYTILLVVIVKVTHFIIPEPVLISLNYITDGYVGFALIALGAQLAEVKFQFKIKEILMASSVKLLIAPLIGFALIILLKIRGVLAQALVIAISTPTAVTSSILAEEFDNERDFAAQIVVVTTVLCTFTLPFIIYLAQKYIS